jgi:hypothetical protein
LLNVPDKVGHICRRYGCTDRLGIVLKIQRETPKLRRGSRQKSGIEGEKAILETDPPSTTSWAGIVLVSGFPQADIPGRLHKDREIPQIASCCNKRLGESWWDVMQAEGLE